MKHAVLSAGLLLFTTLAASADETGAALFRGRKCTACHGVDGSANTPAGKSLKARDLRSPEVQGRKDEELAAVIANGKGKMPAFKSSLSPEQIEKIVHFIRSLTKP